MAVSSSYRLRPRASAVDQLSDGVGVVEEGGRERGLGQSVAVVGDEGAEVEGGVVGVLCGHAGGVAVGLWAPLLLRRRSGEGGCEEGGGEDGEEGGGEVHFEES